MKRIFMAAMVAATFAIGATAQDFAPKAGTCGVEVRFNPLSTTNFSLDKQSIKGRYFFADNMAVTASLGFDYNSDITYGTRYDKGDVLTNKDSYTKLHYGVFNLDLGYEFHLPSYKRIDPYVGASLGLGRDFAGGKKQTEAKEYTVYENVTPDDKHYASTNLRAAAFAGVDFYLYKGLYVGAEVGYGISKKSYSDTKSTRTSDGTDYESKAENADGTVAAGFYVTPTFRLGWNF